MIGKIKWIYPNTSELNRSGCRGGLAEREKLRKALGFDLVEMPGDYVKNISEMSRTDLALGSPFLVREDVANIYVNNASGPVRYSLHTEPALPRRAGGGIRQQLPSCFGLTMTSLTGFGERPLYVFDFGADR